MKYPITKGQKEYNFYKNKNIINKNIIIGSMICRYNSNPNFYTVYKIDEFIYSISSQCTYNTLLSLKELIMIFFFTNWYKINKLFIPSYLDYNEIANYFDVIKNVYKKKTFKF